jgi:hypothetical protein
MYIGMSPPISSTVKDRVVQLHLEGKGRNEIAEILNLSHIRISQGSVTNILRIYKANTASRQAPTKATTDFPKASEPSSPSQLQTSSTLEMKEETIHQAQEVQVQSSEVQDQEESFIDLGWSTVFRQIEEDKKQRRDELLLIEQKKKELEHQRMQIDRARYDLENREARVIEAEPLIPIARQCLNETTTLAGNYTKD